MTGRPGGTASDTATKDGKQVSGRVGFMVRIADCGKGDGPEERAHRGGASATRAVSRR